MTQQLRDEEQSFQSAVRMIRDDDYRTGARDALQLALVEIESHLQKAERVRGKLRWRGRPAAGLTVDVGEPLEGQRPERCVYVERRPVLVHVPRKLMQRHDNHVAQRCLLNDSRSRARRSASPA